MTYNWRSTTNAFWLTSSTSALRQTMDDIVIFLISFSWSKMVTQYLVTWHSRPYTSTDNDITRTKQQYRPNSDKMTNVDITPTKWQNQPFWDKMTMSTPLGQNDSVHFIQSEWQCRKCQNSYSDRMKYRPYSIDIKRQCRPYSIKKTMSTLFSQKDNVVLTHTKWQCRLYSFKEKSRPN